MATVSVPSTTPFLYNDDDNDDVDDDGNDDDNGDDDGYDGDNDNDNVVDDDDEDNNDDDFNDDDDGNDVDNDNNNDDDYRTEAFFCLLHNVMSNLCCSCNVALQSHAEFLAHAMSCFAQSLC